MEVRGQPYASAALPPPNNPVPLCGPQGRSGRFGSRTTDREALSVLAVQTVLHFI